MEFKYTTDGRKVVVIGNLNSQEKIVQEVFISNGQEIPSGENFTVRSLHDHPVESWKDKEIKKMDENYSKRKLEYDRDIKRLEDEYKRSKELNLSLIKNLKSLSKQNHTDVFERVADFIDGKITHVVILGYHRQIHDFTTQVFIKDGYEFMMKLITLYGKSDGSMSFNLNQYGDGSGSRTEIIPCRSFDEAKHVLGNYLLAESKYNSETLKAAQKYDIKLDDSKLKSYYTSLSDNISFRIEKARTDTEKLLSEYAETKLEIEKLS